MFTVTIAPGGQLIFSGEHLFVDDFVTSEDLRGRGHGKELLRWLAGRAREQGIPRVDLDSRITARGFYAKLGFQFLTSIPCWTDGGDLERGGD